MSSLPISPPARTGSALPKSTGSSPPTGAGDFAALLTQTTARTAAAEGPKTRPQDTRRDDRDDAAPAKKDAPAKDAAPVTASAADAPAAPAQPGTPVPAPQAPAADAAPQGDAAPSAPAPAADPNAAAQAALAQLPVAPAAPATGAPAPATPQTQAPTLGADGLPLDPKAVLLAQQAPADGPQAPAGDTPGKLQIPAELLNAKGGQAHAGHQGKDLNKDGAPQQDLPPAPTLPPTANATAAAPASTPQADAPQAQPAPAAPQPAVAQAQPTATPLMQVPTAAGTSQITRGSLVQTAERVQELVRIATTRSGQARATLQLKPEAIGQVDVHLRTTREGLVATIAAHDQAGLDALQQAGGELRRLLSDRGVELQSLDLQLSAGADGGFANQGDAGQAQSGRSGSTSHYGLGTGDDDEVVAEDELTLSPAPLTATSALVDVTA